MSAAMNAREMLTIGQLAEQIGCHVESIRRWERQGLIPPAVRFRGRRLYSPADVDRIRAAVFVVPQREAEGRKEDTWVR